MMSLFCYATPNILGSFRIRFFLALLWEALFEIGFEYVQLLSVVYVMLGIFMEPTTLGPQFKLLHQVKDWILP